MGSDRITQYHSTTLGILAGGRARRLGGVDKASAVYRGKPLIERMLELLGDAFAARLVSTNQHLDKHAALGLRPVHDRIAGFQGPLAGLDALLAACSTPMLLTVPVDLRDIPRDLAARLHAAGDGGAVAHDATRLQPLVALWPVARAREAVAEALEGGERAAHRVVETLMLSIVQFDGADFGNLNTPEDFLN